MSSARPSGTFMAFLVMCFAVLGLAGLFATYAAPLPYERAARIEGLLDRLPQTDPAQWPALKAELGDSAGVLTGTAPLASRIAAERVRLRAAFTREAVAEQAQLRLLIGVVTVVSALFGVVVMRLAR